MLTGSVIMSGFSGEKPGVNNDSIWSDAPAWNDETVRDDETARNDEVAWNEMGG